MSHLKIFKKIGKVIFPIFFVCTGFTSFAQKHEIGLGLGASAYSGEIARFLDVRALRPAGQFYYRLNFSDVVSLKVATSLGVLAASDEHYNNEMAKYRNAEFSGSYNDVTIMAEYNFLNYGYSGKRDRGDFSPYLTAGIGFFGYNNGVAKPTTGNTNSGFQVCIPFGGGVKYRVNAHWSLSYQLIANKTFTDDIDGIYNIAGAPKTIANTHTPDWYYYTGISVGYVFWKVHCPE